MSRSFTVTIALTAAALATASIPSPASAGFVAGTDLVSICKAPKIDPVYRLKTAECLGYVVGVADSFDCKENLHGFHWNSAAVGSQEALVKVVVDWLDHHPDKLGFESDGLIAAALSTAYPCP